MTEQVADAVIAGHQLELTIHGPTTKELPGESDRVGSALIMGSIRGGLRRR